MISIYFLLLSNSIGNIKNGNGKIDFEYFQLNCDHAYPTKIGVNILKLLHHVELWLQFIAYKRYIYFSSNNHSRPDSLRWIWCLALFSKYPACFYMKRNACLSVWLPVCKAELFVMLFFYKLFYSDWHYLFWYIFKILFYLWNVLFQELL